MTSINVETIHHTEPILVEVQDTSDTIPALTVREANLRAADHWKAIKEDDMSPDRIKAIREYHYFMREAARPTEDEMRDELAKEKADRKARTIGRKVLDGILGQ